MKIKPFLEFYAYFYEIAPTFSVRLPVRRTAILSPTLRGAVGNGFIRSAECINAFPTGAIHLQVAQRAGRGRAKTFPWGKVDSKSPDSAILKTDEG